ncbi:hypothetical protein [Mycolicibacterium holsaticum]|uniref:Uncharacterized protein n=1 Tax=Mycolicibacterium holsaticum TaxID=152142 RepID=A0A1E3R6E7_9MYCO|nr:hypothetical protein [Mycolicibacterium holsaticum]ODQ85404.1 hypothetical protein BHQ17_23280 [Mycolicibacterium holsaticum]
MRLTAAFFANRVEVVDGMLNLEGGFWASTTVAPNATAFQCDVVVLCDMDANDVGESFSMVIDAEGPNEQRLPSHTSSFTVEAPMKFMCMPSLVLPIVAGGGYHVYRFRLEGEHARIDVPLAVRLARP